jgi:hypothetical protein
VQLVQSGHRAPLPWVYGLLVSYGRDLIAARMLRENWSRTLLDGKDLGGYYDQQLHERLPEFLQSLPRQELRYLAEVLLAGLPDSPLESDRAAVSRDERIEAVAQRFASIEFSDDAIRRQTLRWIRSHPVARKQLLASLAEVASQSDITSYLTGKASSSYGTTILIVRYLATLLADGDPRPLADLVTTIEQQEDAKRGRKNSVMGAIAQEMVVAAEQQWPQWPAERVAATRTILRRVAKYDVAWKIRRSLAETSLAAHATAGDMDGFRQWYQGLTDDQRKGLGFTYLENKMWSLAAKNLGEPTADNLDRRIKVTGGLIDGCEQLGHLDLSRDEIVLPRVGRLDQYVVPHLMTRDELREHGQRIAEQSPAGGFAWALLATEQTDAGQFESAAKSWAQAYAAAPQDNQTRQTIWRIQHARVLKHLGRTDEAARVLESFDRQLLDVTQKKRWDELLETL